MQQSRISILLKNTRSRHDFIKNPYLKEASIQNFKIKHQSIDADRQLRKIASQIKYYESLNRRLLSKVQKQKLQLHYAEQTRKRIQSDYHKKRRFQQLRKKEIMDNQRIAQKIKQQKQHRQEAVRMNRMQKSFQGTLTRNTKTRLRSQKYENQIRQYEKSRNRVESIIEFECNLRESYVRQKQQTNEKYLKSYKQSIKNRKTNMMLRRYETQSAKERLKVLTQGASNYLSQLCQISKSIHDYRTSRKVSLSPLNFNKEKLVVKSRCYTHENKSQNHNNSTDNSLFFSHNKTQK